MNEYSFTVTKTGYINVEADSLEDAEAKLQENFGHFYVCLLYTSPSPRDNGRSRMPSSA